MKIKLLSIVILMSVSIITFGQTKSLRELLLESDIVAITEKIPDPFYPKEKFVTFSDTEKMTVVDSVKIISYLKKGKKDLKGQRFLIKGLRNGFHSRMRNPEIVRIFHPNQSLPKTKTVLFAKSQKDFNEVFYFKEIDEDRIAEIEKFMVWMNEVQKQKTEAEKCQSYIKKYFSLLRNNTVQDGFLYFENILLPDSSFMLYYNEKSPQATILTKEQQENLKYYLFDEDYFSDVDNTNLVYQYFPEETLEFYKTKLSEVRTYDDEFEDNPDKYSYHLKFVLEKTNKWNRDTELMLEVLGDYLSSNVSLKRDIFERLVEKMNEN